MTALKLLKSKITAARHKCAEIARDNTDGSFSHQLREASAELIALEREYEALLLSELSKQRLTDLKMNQPTNNQQHVGQVRHQRRR